MQDNWAGAKRTLQIHQAKKSGAKHLLFLTSLALCPMAAQSQTNLDQTLFAIDAKSFLRKTGPTSSGKGKRI